MSWSVTTSGAMAFSDAALFTYLHRLFRKRGRAFPEARLQTGWISGEAGPLATVFLPAAGPRRDPAGVVVFMPGTNAYALLYAELFVALSDAGFSVLAFDPRGHGRSAGARGFYTISELVADMRTVCRHARTTLGGPVFAAGSSQGGIVSFYTAATEEPLAGVLCHNLADLGSPAAIECTRLPSWVAAGRGVIDFAGRRAGKVLSGLPIPMNAYIDLAEEPVAGVGTAWDLIVDDPLLVPFVRLRTMGSLANTPLPRPPERITTPVFVLHGENDRIFPLRYVEALYRRIGAPKEFCLVPEAPHYMIVDHIESYRSPMIRWLETRAAAEGSVHPRG